MSIAVMDALEISIGGSLTIACVCFAQIDARVALANILVEHAVPHGIEALADQPAEDVRSVGRVENPRLIIQTIKCNRVVLRDRSPMDFTVFNARPALDPRKKPFYSRPVLSDAVAVTLDVIPYPLTAFVPL